MTYHHPSLITDEDAARELADARRTVSQLLHDVDTFAALEHEQPWRYLDDLLSDLRAAATTVAALERLQGRAG